MFDIDFVTKAFGTCAPGRYLEKFKNAPQEELYKFKKKVIIHRKNNKQQQAYSNVKNYSTHKALISAINYELLKRSKKRYYIYKKLFPLRRYILKILKGIDLKENDLLGDLHTIPKKYNTNFLHSEITIKFATKTVSQVFLYIFKNLYWIAPTVTAAIIAIWLKK